ncbi:MAG: LysM peptidoglycan-binding domain-containing protein [Bacteroidetes bacterium]|nr:LysM peptidoglycan-binding domain-containing protein [Bacteroidota bacterium]MBU1720432.1 LysM peptidoglycan-binding domain-containing protein [Bacteroidota bacterium]
MIYSSGATTYFHYASVVRTARLASGKAVVARTSDTKNGTLLAVGEGEKVDGGAQIAEIAIDSIINFFNKQVYSNLNDALNKAIVFANQQIYFKAHINSQYIEKGTRIALVLFHDNAIYCGRIGDNAILLCRDNKTEMLADPGAVVVSAADSFMPDENQEKVGKSSDRKTLGKYSLLDIIIRERPLLVISNDKLLLFTGKAAETIKSKSFDGMHENQEVFLKELSAKIVADQSGDPSFAIICIHFFNLTKSNQPVVVEKVKRNKSDGLIGLFVNKYTFAIFIILILAGVALLLFAKPWVKQFQTRVHDLIIKEEKIILDDIKQEEKIILEKTEHLVVPEKPDTAETVLAEKTETEIAPIVARSNFYDYVVKKGETLYRVFVKFNNSVEEIKETNGLKNNNIHPGLSLKVKIAAIHIVSEGDTYSTLSAKYSLPAKEIQEANSDQTLIPGETLIIPIYSEKTNENAIQ